METGQKALLTFSVSGLGLSWLLFATTAPVAGFETSVYRAIPLEFWAVFLLGLIPAFIGVYQSDKVGHGTPFVGVIFTFYGLVYALPYLRGYWLHVRGTSDPLVHLGEVRAAQATGSVSSELWYPSTHVFTSWVTHFVSLETAAIFVPFVYTVGYVLFLALAIRRIVDARRAGLALFVSLPLTLSFFHTYLQPAFISTIGLPALAFFILTRERIGQWISAGIQFALLTWMVFTHPLTGILGGILIGTTYGFSWLQSSTSWISEQPRISSSVMFLAFVCVVWLFWVIGSKQFQHAIVLVLTFSESAPGTATSTSALASAFESENPIIFTVKWVSYLYLQTLIPMVVGAGAVAMLAGLELKRRRKVNSGVAYLTIQCIIGAVITAVFLVFYLGPTSPIRVARYAVVMATMGLGIALIYTSRSGSRWRHVASAVLVFCVLSTAVLGVFSIHQTNQHMTKAEYSGVEHTIEYRVGAVSIRSIDISSKTDRYVLGTHRYVGPPAFRTDSRDHIIPPHLGYENATRAGDALGGSYVVTKDYDIDRSKAEIYEEHQRRDLLVYNQSDINRFESDESVMAVYDNGGYRLWRIVP